MKKIYVLRNDLYKEKMLQRCNNDIIISNNFLLENKYRLYEYTDDICVLEDNPLYPGLINYVKTGMLTEEEMIQALLH